MLCSSNSSEVRQRGQARAAGSRSEDVEVAVKAIGP